MSDADEVVAQESRDIQVPVQAAIAEAPQVTQQTTPAELAGWETEGVVSEDEDAHLFAIFDKPATSPEIQALETQRAQVVQQIEQLRMLRQQYERPRRGYGFGPAAGARDAGDYAARMAIAQDIDRLQAYVDQIDAAIETSRR
jgi:hypothetical protein